MRKSIIFTMAIFIASAAHADPVPAAIIKWLKAYQTKSINLQEGVLSVRMDRPKVTRAMYETVVIDGVCMSLIDSPKSWGKANLKKIEVVNVFGVQGYIFKGGAKECNAIGKLNGEQISRDFLPEKTSMK